MSGGSRSYHENGYCWPHKQSQPCRQCVVVERDALRAEVAALRDAACEHGPILCDNHRSAGRRFDIGCVICTGDDAERALADVKEATKELCRDYELRLADARALLTRIARSHCANQKCPCCNEDVEWARAFLARGEGEP